MSNIERDMLVDIKTRMRTMESCAFFEWLHNTLEAYLNAGEADRLREIIFTRNRQITKLMTACQYVLDDEQNLIPRATAECRKVVRKAMEEES